MPNSEVISYIKKSLSSSVNKHNKNKPKNKQFKNLCPYFLTRTSLFAKVDLDRGVRSFIRESHDTQLGAPLRADCTRLFVFISHGRRTFFSYQHHSCSHEFP